MVFSLDNTLRRSWIPNFHRGFRRENPVHEIKSNGVSTTAEAGDFGHRYNEITRLIHREISADARLT